VLKEVIVTMEPGQLRLKLHWQGLRFTAKVNARNVKKSFCPKTRAGWVSRMTVVHLIKDGVLPAKHSCVGAPHVTREADLELPALKRAIKSSRAFSPDPRQGTLEYQ
jgi:hypothetical protein